MLIAKDDAEDRDMRILVATDGSEFSKHALEECCRLFGDVKDKEIKIISVYEDAYALATEPFAVYPGYCQEVIDASRNEARGFTANAVSLLRKKLDDVEQRISAEVLNGIPEQEIVEKAKEWRADVIVVGSHGRGFLGRMLGSVSDGVVHHAPCSVLVVHGGAEK